MPTEILFPFTIASDGSVATVDDPDRQISQHVHALLGTEPGERVMSSNYGVPTRNQLFEPGDTHVAERLSLDVQQQMAAYEPGVLVQQVTPIPGPQGLGIARVQLDYVRREAANTPFGVAKQSNTAVINVGGRVDEVIRG